MFPLRLFILMKRQRKQLTINQILPDYRVRLPLAKPRINRTILDFLMARGIIFRSLHRLDYLVDTNFSKMFHEIRNF